MQENVIGDLHAIVARDLRLSICRRHDVRNHLVFFDTVVMLFPPGVGPDPDPVRRMAPGVPWVAALLAAMLSLQRLFAADYADGALEQMLVSAYPPRVVVFGTTLAR